MKRLWAALTALTTATAVAGIATPDAGAAPTRKCTFTITATTLRLTHDCATTASIVIPDGYTLNGAGHTITAVDPSGDRFRGAVITNGGSSAFVKDVTVVGATANTTCSTSSADKFRGIQINQAWGSVTDSRVENINFGAGSTCDEGTGIIIQMPAGTTPPHRAVVTGDTVTGAQLYGVFVGGDLKPVIENNTVSIAADTVPTGGHPGIALSATHGGLVSDNHVDAGYTGVVAAVGINVFQTSRLTANDNTVTNAGAGVVLQSECTATGLVTSDNTITGNVVSAANLGIALVANTTGGSTCAPHVDGNVMTGNTIDGSASASSVGVQLMPIDNGFPYRPSVNHNTVTGNTLEHLGTAINDDGRHNVTEPNTIIP